MQRMTKLKHYVPVSYTHLDVYKRQPQPRPVSQVQFARIIQESRQRPIGPLSSDYELKEHHEGEPVRRIHYKASYRLQKTMVREFQKEESAYLPVSYTHLDVYKRQVKSEGIVHYPHTS